MFDLEQAIADWRRQMAAGGVKSLEVLDELESHLRDDVEQQVRSGVNAQQAFKAATQNIGQVGALKSEFTRSERTTMKRTMIILLGVFGVLFGPGMILPALAKYKHQPVWSGAVVVPLVVGAMITLVGVTTTIYGFTKRRA